MKTTLEIEEGVMRRLKERAAQEGVTMSGLVEAALRAFLDRRPEAARELPPLPAWHGGGLLVNIDDNAALRELLDRCDGEDAERERRARGGEDDADARR
jgi:hypothetical protein